MDASQRGMAQVAGVPPTDAGLEGVAKSEPTFTSHRLIGQLSNGIYIYELDGPKAYQVIFLHLDKNGLVDLNVGMQPVPR
jgi:hypothetical protein